MHSMAELAVGPNVKSLLDVWLIKSIDFSFFVTFKTMETFSRKEKRIDASSTTAVMNSNCYHSMQCVAMILTPMTIFNNIMCG